MKIEELAYKITDIKKIPIGLMWVNVQFSGEIGYLKNESATPLRFSIKHPTLPADQGGYVVENLWGVNGVSDGFMQIDAQETVGPLHLHNCYVQGTDAHSQLIVLIHEVR